jgi:hypothetical protein
MDNRQWSVTIMYLLGEVAMFSAIFYFILAVETPPLFFDNVIPGIIFSIVASCFACCGCCTYRSRLLQEQAPVNMDVVMVPDPSVRLYPMSDDVYNAAPITVGIAPSQVVHGSDGSYLLPAAYSPPSVSPTAVSTTAPVKEDFRA